MSSSQLSQSSIDVTSSTSSVHASFNSSNSNSQYSSSIHVPSIKHFDTNSSASSASSSTKDLTIKLNKIDDHNDGEELPQSVTPLTPTTKQSFTCFGDDND
eukprot:170342_1